ncbi:hypothetical protein PPERSA_10223 [Pseudocohnilembus persalinus]|uniref:Uncharacterized protein n=1 Tax=Pseudocohnilembus persalinus TaxID=266149 RepID=A0A0V0QLN7_PSEPJ|nr:hypothetical protein PPERSA_10223 [Pseudocohnilembus persalinus]|eukprot:KRX03142.1 hypothetical protein PPERSA_10223 [Pseudocohnilembus persalinus]
MEIFSRLNPEKYIKKEQNLENYLHEREEMRISQMNGLIDKLIVTPQYQQPIFQNTEFKSENDFYSIFKVKVDQTLERQKQRDINLYKMEQNRKQIHNIEKQQKINKNNGIEISQNEKSQLLNLDEKKLENDKNYPYNLKDKLSEHRSGFQFKINRQIFEQNSLKKDNDYNQIDKEQQIRNDIYLQQIKMLYEQEGFKRHPDFVTELKSYSFSTEISQKRGEIQKKLRNLKLKAGHYNEIKSDFLYKQKENEQYPSFGNDINTLIQNQQQNEEYLKPAGVDLNYTPQINKALRYVDKKSQLYQNDNEKKLQNLDQNINSLELNLNKIQPQNQNNQLQFQQQQQQVTFDSSADQSDNLDQIYELAEKNDQNDYQRQSSREKFAANKFGINLSNVNMSELQYSQTLQNQDNSVSNKNNQQSYQFNSQSNQNGTATYFQSQNKSKNNITNQHAHNSNSNRKSKEQNKNNNFFQSTNDKNIDYTYTVSRNQTQQSNQKSIDSPYNPQKKLFSTNEKVTNDYEKQILNNRNNINRYNNLNYQYDNKDDQKFEQNKQNSFNQYNNNNNNNNNQEQKKGEIINIQNNPSSSGVASINQDSFLQKQDNQQQFQQNYQINLQSNGSNNININSYNKNNNQRRSRSGGFGQRFKNQQQEIINKQNYQDQDNLNIIDNEQGQLSGGTFSKPFSKNNLKNVKQQQQFQQLKQKRGFQEKKYDEENIDDEEIQEEIDVVENNLSSNNLNDWLKNDENIAQSYYQASQSNDQGFFKQF